MSSQAKVAIVAGAGIGVDQSTTLSLLREGYPVYQEGHGPSGCIHQILDVDAVHSNLVERPYEQYLLWTSC